MNIVEKIKKAQIVNKISIKNMSLNVKALVKKMENGESLPILAVLGSASGLKTGESQFGTWVKLTGTFGAVDLINEDAEAFRSANLFLPDIALDMVVGALQAIESGSVNLGFELSVIADDTVNIGYRYGVRELMPLAENDPLVMLGNQIAQYALPAPEKNNGEENTSAKKKK